MSDIGKPIEPFRFWCQHVIPLVYDDSLSYYELLNKVVYKLNEIISVVNNNEIYSIVEKILNEWWENGYFDEIIASFTGIVSNTDVNIYVSAGNGNDDNIGSKNSPIKTTEKINEILYLLVKGSVNILIDNTGGYNELNISNSCANLINVVGTDNTFTELPNDYMVNIRNISFSNSQRVYVKHFKITASSNYCSFVRNTFVLFSYCIFDNTPPNSSIGATENSNVVLENCSLSGNVGVSCNYLSKCFATNTTILSKIGFWPKFGSQTSYYNCTFSPECELWIFNDSGSLQLSQIGNTNKVASIFDLTNVQTISFDGANVSAINNITLIIFNEEGIKSFGICVYNQRSKAYDQYSVSANGLSYNIGFFTNSSGAVNVVASEIQNTLLKLTATGPVNNEHCLIYVS